MNGKVTVSGPFSKPIRNWFFFITAFFILMPRYLTVSLNVVNVNFNVLVITLTCIFCFATLYVSMPLLQDTQRGINRSKFLFFSIILYVGWQFISNMHGPLPSLAQINSIRYAIALESGFLIGIIFFNDARIRRGFVIVFILCILIVCVIGILERISGYKLLAILNVASIAGEPGLAQQMAATTIRNGGLRASVTFSHSIAYGQFVAAAAPLCALFALQKADKNLSLLATTTTALIPFAAYASGSKSAWFVIVAATICAIVFVQKGSLYKKFIRFSTVGIFGVIAYIITKDWLRHIFFGVETVRGARMLPSRMLMLINGLYKVQLSPIFGYGAGLAVYEAGLKETGGAITIDSLYLSVALEFGLVGLALLASVFVITIIYGYKLSQRLNDWWDRYLVVGMSALVVGICVGQSVLSIPENMFYLYLSAGMFTAMLGYTGKPTTSNVS